MTHPRRTILAAASALYASGLLCGCMPAKKSIAYYGPTLPLTDVVARINQRNVAVTSLWASGDFSAHLIDPDTKKATSGDGDLTLLYQPKKSLRVVGKVLSEKVFDIGANDDRYWLILPQQIDAMWWGYQRLIGQNKASRLPIRPDLLPEVLAVTPLDSDLLKEPAPTLRFNNDQDCYMVTWNVLLGDRWAVQKEVWYDRQTLQPRLVLLFDPNGCVALRAYLSGYHVIDGYSPAVQIASRYDMFFPDTGSTFSITLKDLEKSHNNAPNDRSFAFPGDRAGVSKVIQIDE